MPLFKRVSVSRVLLAVLAFTFFTSCGNREFTDGKYDDLSKDRLLDDKFGESDMRQIADTMITSLVNSPVMQEQKKRPVILVTLVKNRTEEHIDMKSMTDKIKVAVIKSGKFRFTEKENREELQSELTYQNQSGYVDPETARAKGKQVGADYFLTGEITDHVQEVGSQKYVFYKATFNLVGIQSGLLDWSDEREIRKAFKKKSVGY